MLDRLKQRAREFQRDTYALYLACRDPRVPWYAKAVAAAVLAYALSPIDLIPDFIPVLGYLDDLVLIPLGIALARRMIPARLLVEHRAAAQAMFDARAPSSGVGAAVVIALWAVVLVGVAAIALGAL